MDTSDSERLDGVKHCNQSCVFSRWKTPGYLQCYSFFVVGESVALSLAIPMSVILETLMDDDVCGDAWVLKMGSLC